MVVNNKELNSTCSIMHAESSSPSEAPRIDKHALSNRFGARSNSYEKVTPVQQAMGMRLMLEVQQLMSGQNVCQILELGCGTGRLTRHLAKIYPEAEIVAVDISHEMIAHAKEQYPQAHYVIADAEDYVFKAQQKFDLIVSNATIQWFEKLEATLMQTRSLLASDGLLAIATFGERTFIELEAAFNQAYDLKHMQRRSHVVAMPSIKTLRSILPNAKLIEDEFCSTFQDAREFMKSIKDAGAVNSQANRQAIPKAILSSMMDIYNTTYRHLESGRVLATYHSCYLLDKHQASA